MLAEHATFILHFAASAKKLSSYRIFLSDIDICVNYIIFQFKFIDLFMFGTCTQLLYSTKLRKSH